MYLCILHIFIDMHLHPNLNSPNRQRIITPGTVCKHLWDTQHRTHNITLANRARSIVKNGTCQQRKRQEWGAITRDWEKEGGGERRRNREIRDTWRKSNRNEERWEEAMKGETWYNESGETEAGLMKRVTGGVREWERKGWTNEARGGETEANRQVQ